MNKQKEQSRQQFKNCIEENYPDACEMAEYAMWLVWRASREKCVLNTKNRLKTKC
ncbi:TPA: hypothetical protein OUB26_001438 [Proteus mirabilis]|uniref:hypothetical protein n=1 Tax=Proteus mirabilis TaxID=584 RepID=UPI0003841DA1|nr:hypothetical protein [Proteus mirabilis]AZF93136.1 MAG: hypothetical protein [Phage NG55]AGS59395.1 hypothetical protein BB2000_0900 [Proteus mirabilis BB2000]HBC6622489.1 hypothetical protein [Proteus mirabilis]HCT9034382.1 hypothetical protein [Proteus mirabilis]HCU0904157.1 hypothetical protein [Proteus mirabilis]